MTVIKTNCSKMTELRIKRGMKGADLARKVGVTRQAISAIERGESNPSPDVAKKITEALNITFDDLFTIES